MHSQVDPLLEQRLIQLSCEETLPSDLRERPVPPDVAARPDDRELNAPVRDLLEAASDPRALGLREEGAAGADPKGVVEAHQFDWRPSMIPCTTRESARSRPASSLPAASRYSPWAESPAFSQRTRLLTRSTT